MESRTLVYCTKCGTQNPDDAQVCSQCGASLATPGPPRRYRSEDECFGPRENRRREDECFGLPHGGAIVGIIFGIIIIFIGIAIYTGLTNVWNVLGPLVIVIIGILLIAGALYGMRQRY
jgi:uncharacterized membrane protein YvbJ